MRPIRLGIQRRKRIKRFLTREEIENTEFKDGSCSSNK